LKDATQVKGSHITRQPEAGDTKRPGGANDKH